MDAAVPVPVLPSASEVGAGCIQRDSRGTTNPPFQLVLLDLPEWTSLLHPAKALFNQPASAQTDGVSLVARGSAIQRTASAVVALSNIHRHAG